MIKAASCHPVKVYNFKYLKIISPIIEKIKGKCYNNENGTRGEKTDIQLLYAKNTIKLSDNMEEIKIGKYRHFKGNEYEVLYIAKHSETQEDMVVYRALYGDHEVWVRPASMWNETVERDGKTYKRFEYIDKEDTNMPSSQKSRSVLYSSNFAVGRIDFIEKEKQDGQNAAVTAFLSCLEYYVWRMKDGTENRGERWVYCAGKPQYLEIGSFETQMAHKLCACCNAPANWGLVDLGLRTETSIDHIYGGTTGNFGHKSQFMCYAGAFTTITDWTGKNMQFKYLYQSGLVKPGDIFLTVHHTFVYRGGESFYAAGHDGVWHTEADADTDDPRKAVFEDWICGEGHKKSFTSCSNYNATICWQIRFNDDYEPKNYRDTDGKLKENPQAAVNYD